MRLFLDNRFEDSRSLCAAAAEDSPYHGLGYSTVLCIKAALTCESVSGVSNSGHRGVQYVFSILLVLVLYLHILLTIQNAG